MKKRIAIIACIYLTLTLSARAVHPQDFGHLWGDPLESFGPVISLGKAEVEKAEVTPPILFYRKVNEVANLGEIPVLAIEYGFYENSLVSIQLVTTHTDLVRDMLMNRYGEPTFTRHVDIWHRPEAVVITLSISDDSATLFLLHLPGL